MVVLCVVLLVGAVLWIFGTLPWLAINYLLCSSGSSITCADPVVYRQQALLILTLDTLLLAIGIFSAFQLRALSRFR